MHHADLCASIVTMQCSSNYYHRQYLIFLVHAVIGGHSGKGILGKLIPAFKQDHSKNESKRWMLCFVGFANRASALILFRVRNKALQQLKAVDAACQDSQKKTKNDTPAKVLVRSTKAPFVVACVHPYAIQNLLPAAIYFVCTTFLSFISIARINK